MERDRIDTPNLKSSVPGLNELAVSQGVSPVMDFDSLIGRPSSEDESVDEFAAMLREWRREGTGPASRQ